MNKTRTVRSQGTASPGASHPKSGKRAPPSGGSELSPKKAKQAVIIRPTHQHPDHSVAIKRLNRVIGQLQGIQRMIEGRRYCPEILVQTRAAASALKAVELSILERHLHHCVANAVKSADTADSERKIQELIALFTRF